MAAEHYTIIVIDFVTLILSLPGNIFIIAVNIVDFCRNRRLPLSDRLIFGFSAFCFLHGVHEGYIRFSVLFLLPIDDDRQASMYYNMCTLWFSALLSIHFCLKIVTINHWVYIRLQRRFPKVSPWIILVFFFGYIILSVYFGLEIKQECLRNTTTSNNVSLKASPRCSWLLLIFLIISVFSTFLCSVSASTILISLLKHMKRIQESSEGSGSPNIEAHIRAVRTVSSLLVANILIFASVFINTFGGKIWDYLYGILIFVCHIISSYCIIKGTKKLEKTLVEILSRCQCIRGKW